MKARNVVMALVLVLIGHTAASAATLRTSPFNSFNVNRGFARCLVTNGSTSKGTATVTLFDARGDVLDSGSEAIFPHHTVDNTAGFSFTDHQPAYCECTVPSATTWRCSFVYMDTLDGAPSVITNIDGK